MNVFGFLLAAFGRLTAKQIETVRKSGEADGELAASAYADGFLSGADRVLKQRLQSHNAIEVESVAKPVNRTNGKHARAAK